MDGWMMDEGEGRRVGWEDGWIGGAGNMCLEVENFRTFFRGLLGRCQKWDGCCPRR